LSTRSRGLASSRPARCLRSRVTQHQITKNTRTALAVPEYPVRFKADEVPRNYGRSRARARIALTCVTPDTPPPPTREYAWRKTARPVRFQEYPVRLYRTRSHGDTADLVLALRAHARRGALASRARSRAQQGRQEQQHRLYPRYAHALPLGLGAARQGFLLLEQVVDEHALVEAVIELPRAPHDELVQEHGGSLRFLVQGIAAACLPGQVDELGCEVPRRRVGVVRAGSHSQHLRVGHDPLAEAGHGRLHEHLHVHERVLVDLGRRGGAVVRGGCSRGLVHVCASTSKRKSQSGASEASATKAPSLAV
jgi:hypothetical protein